MLSYLKVKLAEIIMDCPVCKSAMIVLELDEVEVDYCTDCEGIWLDAGELELLLGGAAASDALLGSFQSAKTAEQKRKCPICLKKMDKVLVGDAAGLASGLTGEGIDEWVAWLDDLANRQRAVA